MHRIDCLFIFIVFFSAPCFGQKWKQFSTANSTLLSNDVRSLLKTNDNRIYAGTPRGLTYYKNGTWQQTTGGVSTASIYRLWTSKDSLWVGTEFNGLWRYYNNTWRNYDPNTSGNGVLGFGQDSRDSIYRLDKFGEFNLWNGASWTRLTYFFSQPNNLFVDRNDTAWLLSNNTGLMRYKDGVFKSLTNTYSPTDPYYMLSASLFDMTQDASGNYWIASDNGLLKLNGQNIQVYNTQNSGIASNRTRCITIDTTGSLWIGTWDSGVSKFNGSTWVNYNIRNSPLTSPIISDIIADSANNIWIANGYNPYTSPSNGQGIYILDEDQDLSNGQLPNAPASLTAKVISVNKAVLTWADLSNNETGFALERSAKDSLHFQQIKFVMDNVGSFADQTLTDTAYYYRIRAVNSIGYSTYSNIVKVNPRYCVVNETSYGAYAIIKKVAFGTINKETTQCIAGYYDYLDLNTSLYAGQTLMLTVSFDRCNITSDPIIGGVVYIDWNSDGDFTDSGELVFTNNNINGKGEFSFPVTIPSNVVPGTITRLRVRVEDDVYANTIIASCNYAETTHDYTLSITNVPTSYIPSKVSFKNISSKKINLNWQDNANGETGYLIERSLDSTTFSGVAALAPNTIQYTDSLLQPNTKYYYRITVNKATGNATSLITRATTLPADLVRQWRGQAATDNGFNLGAYWGDYNGDNKFDLYISGNNRLYTNQDSVLNNSNLPFHYTNTAAAWADYDNDGDQDIFIGDSLYENSGAGTFIRRSLFTLDGPINNCVWTDFNKDGFLDLYISYLYQNYGKLYRNNGNRTFTMVRRFDYNGYASFADYDNDGDDDLLIMGNSQVALYNLQDTTFVLNTSNGIAPFIGSSKGVSWADYDNDGDLDFFVPNSNSSNFSYSRMYINTGAYFYYYILPNVEFSVSGSAWADYDNDGYQDLFISRFQKTNKLLRNVNNQLTEVPESVYIDEDFGAYPYNELTSMGCAWADYNRDGFLDLFVAQNNGFTNRLYKNGTNQNHWLHVLLQGIASNKNAIGTMIKIKANSKWQYRWIQSTSGYGGENSIAAEFGLGTTTTIDSIVIRWPSGIVQQLGSVTADQFVTISEPAPCAVNYNIWTGTVSTAWENPANWSCGIVPDSTTNIIIPNSANVVINSNVSINSLKLSTSSTLRVNNGFSVTVLH